MIKNLKLTWGSLRCVDNSIRIGGRKLGTSWGNASTNAQSPRMPEWRVISLSLELVAPAVLLLSTLFWSFINFFLPCLVILILTLLLRVANNSVKTSSATKPESELGIGFLGICFFYQTSEQMLTETWHQSSLNLSQSIFGIQWQPQWFVFKQRRKHK